MNAVKSPKTEEDIKQQLNELFIGLHIEKLKIVFKDNIKVTEQINNGIYLPLKFDGDIGGLYPTDFVMDYRN